MQPCLYPDRNMTALAGKATGMGTRLYEPQNTHQSEVVRSRLELGQLARLTIRALLRQQPHPEVLRMTTSAHAHTPADLIAGAAGPVTMVNCPCV